MAEQRSFFEWLVTFRNPAEIWDKQPTFLLCEIVFLLMAALTFIHAVRHGGCYILLWIGTLLHGLTTECVSYFLPDIDNFWHSQSTIMLVEQRLPLHIFLFYPATIYTASIAVSKQRLPFLAEPFAVGLADVLLDFPFDIMGIKLLWWTWHDTDPSIFDRHYHVPWTSYIFHMSFAFSVTFIFHGTRRMFIGVQKYQPSNRWIREIICVILTGLFSMPFAVIQFLFFYHLPHDFYGIHTEIVVCIMAMVYGLVVWRADRNTQIHSRSEAEAASTNTREQKDPQVKKQSGKLDEISFNVILHFTFYVLLVIFAKPQNEIATGLHQQVGDCGHKTPVHTPLGQVLYKNTYLCTNNYNEPYFDWHCTPNSTPPQSGSRWYTVCGTQYTNHAEYILVVVAFSFMGLFIYYQMIQHNYASEQKSVKKLKEN